MHEEFIDRLARRARQEDTPRVDVVADVLRIVRADRAPAAQAPLIWTATAAASFAGLALIFGAAMWDVWMDPLIAVLLDIAWKIG
jgi:hypothetical protein